VKTHLSHIYAKLDVRDRHQALARAIALGYLH
jgi:DNA-binding CsgD family transcriptional regulator